MQNLLKLNKQNIAMLFFLQIALLAHSQHPEASSFYQRGIINTIAGTGTNGYSGNNGAAYDAQVNSPTDIAIDSKGNKYFVDAANYVIRKIDAVTGVIDVYAGDANGQPPPNSHNYPYNNTNRLSAKFKYPHGITIDNSDNIYITDIGFHVVQRINPATNIISIVVGNTNGQPGTVSSTGLNQPTQVATDNSGNLYIIDAGNYVIKKSNFYGSSITVFAGNGNDWYSGDNLPAIQASFTAITGIALNGNYLYIACDLDQRIRRVSLSSPYTITTFLYNPLNSPRRICFNSKNDLFFSDDNASIRVIYANNNPSEIVVNNTIYGGGTFPVSEHINGDYAAYSLVQEPYGMAFDKCDNLYFCDGASRVRVVHYNNAGVITHPVKGYGIGKTTININNTTNTGSSATERLANAYGSYNWSSAYYQAANYKFTPSKPYVNGVTTTKQALSGVSDVDILMIKYHNLNTTRLNNPYKCIAADVDFNGVINSVDVLRIQRLILGTDKSFPNNKLWSFINSSVLFGDNNLPFSTASLNGTTINNVDWQSKLLNNFLGCNPTSQNFYGVKLGDVDWDWNPQIAKGVKPIELYYNNINATELENITIPVRVNNFEGVSGMQFSLSFDPTHFEFNDFENASLNFEYNANNAGTENNTGVISFIWTGDEAEPVTLSDGSVLFNLTLHKKRAVKTDDIVLTSDLTKVQAVNDELELIPVTKKRCKIIDNSIGSVEEYTEAWDILPNYSNMGNILIKAKASENKTLNLQIIDKDDNVVYQAYKEVTEGDNFIFASLRSKVVLPQGVYFVKLDGLTDVESKPFFVGDIDAYATDEEIASNDISGVVTNDHDLALYSLQTQLYKKLSVDASLVTSTLLSDFISNTSATTKGTLYNIETAITDADYSTAATLLSALTPANAVETNYKNYFTWILKLINKESFTTTDEDDLNTLVVQCPLTAGFVVLNARDLSNSLTEENTQFGDVCPVNNTTSRKNNVNTYRPHIATPKPINRTKQIANSHISVYPNPTKGLVHILIPSDEKAIWTITVQDVLGKVLSTKQTTALTKSMDVQVSNQRGMYFITLTNTKTNKRFVEKVVVK